MQNQHIGERGRHMDKVCVKILESRIFQQGKLIRTCRKPQPWASGCAGWWVGRVGGVSRCRCHGDAAPGRRIPTPAVSAAAPAPRTSDTRCEKAQPPCHCGDHELEEPRNRFIHYTAITSDNPLVQTLCLSSGGRRFEFRAFLRNFRNHFLRNHLLRGEGEQREGTYVFATMFF